MLAGATSSSNADQIVKRDSSGNFTANSITANLVGNVTGSASQVGTSSGVQVDAAVALSSGATNIATASTLVKRDGTGAINVKAAKLEDPGGGHTISLRTLSLGASYTLTFPSTAGAANQVLQTDGFGTLSWVNAGGGIVTGTASGNVLTADTSLQPGGLAYVTNSGLNTDSSGFFWDDGSARAGIGTTSPASKLSVAATNPTNPVMDLKMASGQTAGALVIKDNASAVVAQIQSNGVVEGKFQGAKCQFASATISASTSQLLLPNCASSGLSATGVAANSDYITISMPGIYSVSASLSYSYYSAAIDSVRIISDPHGGTPTVESEDVRSALSWGATTVKTNTILNITSSTQLGVEAFQNSANGVSVSGEIVVIYLGHN